MLILCGYERSVQDSCGLRYTEEGQLIPGLIVIGYKIIDLAHLNVQTPADAAYKARSI